MSYTSALRRSLIFRHPDANHLYTGQNDRGPSGSSSSYSSSSSTSTPSTSRGTTRSISRRIRHGPTGSGRSSTLVAGTWERGGSFNDRTAFGLDHCNGMVAGASFGCFAFAARSLIRAIYPAISCGLSSCPPPSIFPDAAPPLPPPRPPHPRAGRYIPLQTRTGEWWRHVLLAMHGEGVPYFATVE